MPKMLSKIVAKISSAFVLALLLACKTNSFFPTRYYYNGDDELRFYPDNSFTYSRISHIGQVSKFGKGTWREDGIYLFLASDVSDNKQVPITINSYLSNVRETELVLNLLPKDFEFGDLKGIEKLLNVELFLDSTVYKLKNRTTVIQLPKRTSSFYFKVYPRRQLGNGRLRVDILNDTLRSNVIDIKELEGQTLSVEVDCDPRRFAQIEMSIDTVQVVNKNKIKWRGRILNRVH